MLSPAACKHRPKHAWIPQPTSLLQGCMPQEVIDAANFAPNPHSNPEPNSLLQGWDCPRRS